MVNPNRLDDLSELGHLAAVGLVFMTVVAVNRELRRRGFWSAARPEPDLLDLLDLVALGTVADVVPLKGLNRAFVAKGLLAMRRREHVGLTALMDVARLGGPPEPWHLGFLLGPRINAGGRIGRAALGVDLLLADDPIEAARIAAELDRLNRERRAIEVATVAQAEAEAMAALGIEEKGAVVVTAAEGWHPGVVGLVAARLKERFGRPAFAIALEPGGIGTGSGRSIAGVDLGRVVRQAVGEGLLIKGGGHAMAAGVTLRKDALAAFRAFLEDQLGDAVAAARRDDALLIDGALTAAAATGETIATLAQAGPFGAGNPEPVVALPAHTLAYADEVGQAHVRVRLRSGDGTGVNAIAFRAVGQKLGAALTQNRGRSHACRGLPRARPLAGRGAGAAAHPGRGGGRCVHLGADGDRSISAGLEIFVHHIQHLRRLVDHGVERFGDVVGADVTDVDLRLLRLPPGISDRPAPWPATSRSMATRSGRRSGPQRRTAVRCRAASRGRPSANGRGRWSPGPRPPADDRAPGSACGSTAPSDARCPCSPRSRMVAPSAVQPSTSRRSSASLMSLLAA